MSFPFIGVRLPLIAAMIPRGTFLLSFYGDIIIELQHTSDDTVEVGPRLRSIVVRTTPSSCSVAWIAFFTILICRFSRLYAAKSLRSVRIVSLG
jgi:hypothetical protein